MLSKRLEQLFDAHLDGELTASEAKELIALLDDPACRAQWRQLATFTGRMQEDLSGEEARVEVERRVHRPAAERVPVRWGTWAAVAACLAIVAGAALYNRHRQERFVETILAHIEKSSPEAVVIRRGEAMPAVVGLKLHPGDVIRTTAPLLFAYPDDGTRVRVKERTELSLEGEGKRLKMKTGDVECTVTTQPEDRPMVVVTPHAEAIVKGTVFRLSVRQASTTLNVDKGTVVLSRRSDGASAEVGQGQYAAAGAGLAPSAHDLEANGLFAKLVPAATAARTVADLSAMEQPIRTAYDEEANRTGAFNYLKVIYLGTAMSIAHNPRQDRQADDMRFLIHRALAAHDAGAEDLSGSDLLLQSVKKYGPARIEALKGRYYYWRTAMIDTSNLAWLAKRFDLLDALRFETLYINVYEGGLPNTRHTGPKVDEIWLPGSPCREYYDAHLHALAERRAETFRRLEAAVNPGRNTVFDEPGTWKTERYSSRDGTFGTESWVVSQLDPAVKETSRVFPSTPFRDAVITGRVCLHALGKAPADKTLSRVFHKIKVHVPGKGNGLWGTGLRTVDFPTEALGKGYIWFWARYRVDDNGTWRSKFALWWEGRQPFDIMTLENLTEEQFTRAHTSGTGTSPHRAKPSAVMSVGSRNASAQWTLLGLNVITPAKREKTVKSGKGNANSR